MGPHWLHSIVFAISCCSASGALAFEEVELTELDLTLDLPDDIENLTDRGGQSAQLAHSWTGELEEAQLSIQLWLLPIAQFRFQEPADVNALIADNYRRDRDRVGGGAGFAWSDQRMVRGKFGVAPYGCLTRAELQAKGRTDLAGTLHMVSGLLPESGYALQVVCQPAANEDQTALIEDFLENGVNYQGDQRNAEWDEEEVAARWAEHAPESAQGREFRKPIRTDHYIILTNSSGGKSFAKKMEENYKKIKKVYPFEDVPGQKLMPVFLFRTNNQYYEFCQSVAGWTLSHAQSTKGHAWKDYYATWYESPNDPVHIHEATHQIFSNRLHLGGGGSWFQEGVAEYIETKKNDRNNVSRMVEKGQSPSWRELMSLRSLVGSSAVDARFGDQTGNNYKLCALIVEFLREDRWCRDHFQQYLHTVGHVPRGNVEAIDRALERVFGENLDAMEKRFQAYCKKR